MVVLSLRRWSLLEYLQGDGGVLDGHDNPAVVQVQDMMFLLKHLPTQSDSKFIIAHITLNSDHYNVSVFSFGLHF